MARPIKKGLDYYPQDVDLFNDRKIKRLIVEFGSKGFITYEYIKSRCFKENGYWVQFDDNFCFDISDSLKAGIDETLAMEVILGCLRFGLFNQKVFDMFKIITSSGIQRRYLEAKRNPVIVTEIWVIAAETPIDVILTRVIAAESTQSKLDKRKVKESIDDEIKNSKPFQVFDVPVLSVPHAPPLQKVIEFFYQQGKTEKSDAERFYYHFEALGWRVGITPIFSWQSMASKWIANPLDFGKKEPQKDTTKQDSKFDDILKNKLNGHG